MKPRGKIHCSESYSCWWKMVVLNQTAIMFMSATRDHWDWHAFIWTADDPLSFVLCWMLVPWTLKLSVGPTLLSGRKLSFDWNWTLQLDVASQVAMAWTMELQVLYFFNKKGNWSNDRNPNRKAGLKKGLACFFYVPHEAEDLWI